MYIVGTESMTVADLVAVPTGLRHAVARDGLQLCGPVRPRFTWPALTWDVESPLAETCATCAQVSAAAVARDEPADAFTVDVPVDAYPAERLVPVQFDALLEPSEW